MDVFNRLILLSSLANQVASSYQDALDEGALTLATPPVTSGLYHFLGGKSAMDIRHYQNACHWLACLGGRFVAVLVLLLSFLGSAFAADHAVILMYHRFGEDRLPSTSIRLDQFDAHLEKLSNGNYSVWPLSKIVVYLQKDMPLPDRTVAITIDDAYLSVFTEAWPRLKAKGFPFTVFVATDPIDRKNRGYMSWDQLRQLQADGVGIGSQTASHPHMHLSSLADVDVELQKSNQRFLNELGLRPNLFAYPYGEYNLAVIERVKAAGFIAGFGQNSGIAHGYDGYFELPRFAMNERYGAIDRLSLAIDGLPLKANQILPADVVIGKNPPIFGFTLAPEIATNSQLRCFNNTYDQLKISRLGPRAEVRFPGPLPSGRARVNCTMPGPNGRWRWFGKQFLVP
ncbi:polysaccharide deacetylase family protein [Alphaproteobacteria bacterium]|nr:polysaccharide deacetylase family protein [Alphaproteobacteria bacterium]